MTIIKTTEYRKDVQKKIIKKHKEKELEVIQKIEELMIQSNNMKELILNPLSNVYNIEKKKRTSKNNLYC